MAADVEDPDHLLPCAQRSCDVVAVLILDTHGRLLLQERDEHAPVAPDQWGLVGGHVEPGEDRAVAMRRELSEETGLSLPDGVLELWYDGERTIGPKARPGLHDHWQLWVAVTELEDGDIVLGEGRRIVFVDPADLPGLDLAPSAAVFLPELLGSTAYRRLRSAGRAR